MNDVTKSPKTRALSEDTRSKLIQILQDVEQTNTGPKKLEFEDGEHKTLSIIPHKIQTQLLRCFNCSEDVAKEYKIRCFEVTNGPSEEELEWTVEPEVAKYLIQEMLKGKLDFCVTRYGSEYKISY